MFALFARVLLRTSSTTPLIASALLGYQPLDVKHGNFKSQVCGLAKRHITLDILCISLRCLVEDTVSKTRSAK